MRMVALFATAAVLLGSSAGPGSPDLQEKDDAAAKAALLNLLDRLIPAVEAELARDGADPTDVRALARRLGTPQAALQFVRDNIAFEPYAGALRGPEGALLARAANSWDQALLLQALLQAMGQPSRIVQAKLDEAQGNALVDAFLQAAPRQEPAVDEQKALADAARMTGISVAELEKLLGRQQTSADAALLAMQQLATAHAGVLRAALKDHAVDAAAMRAVAVASVRQHAFVQLAARVGGEVRYQDLDATPLGAADGASSSRGAEPIAQLPRHTLRLQLLYKTSAAETPILDFTADFAAALREPLALQISPADGLPPLSQLAAMTQEQVQATWQRIKLWQAVLRTGSTDRSSRVFDLDGGLHDVAGDGRIRAAGDLGAAATIGFGGLGGEADKPAKSSFEQLTLVATVRAPDGGERTFPRPLLDAAGRARGESPAANWDILALGGPVGSAFVSHVELAAQLQMFQLARLSLTGDDAAASQNIDKIAGFAPATASLTLLRLQLGRERQTADLAQRAGVRAWYSEPQLLVLRQRGSPCPADRGCVSIGFDWMASDVRFLPREAAAGPAAFAAAIEQGAFDTVIEAVALERSTPAAAVTSAAHALTRARNEGRGVAAGPDRNGRLALAIAGEDAWYEVDRLFGCAVGRLPGGLGGATATPLPQALLEFAKSQSPHFWMLMCMAPNVYGAATGKRKAASTVVSMVGCIVGYKLRGASWLAGVAGRKGLEWALGRLGDAVSAFFSIGGFFI